MAKAPPVNPVVAWFKGVDDYWFGKGSPTALGVFRILFGALSLMNLMMLYPQFEDWFTEKGYVPQAVGKAFMGEIGRSYVAPNHHEYQLPFDFPRLDIFGYPIFADSRVMFGAFLLLMVCSFLTMIGYWTKAATIILALGMVSLQHRNAGPIHGGDVVLRIGLLYLALSPCGRACSVERLVRIWKGIETSVAPQVSLWSQRLLAYNLALIYFTTFWIKFGFGSKWRDLTATFYPNRLHEFERFPVPEFLINPPFVQITTLITLVTELALGTLVFYKPLRGYVLAAGIMMHAFIEYSMNIPMFAFYMTAIYVNMYSGEEIAEWAERWGRRLKRFAAHVYVPAGMILKPVGANLLHALDPLKLVSYDGGSAATWTAETAKGPANPYRVSATRSLGAWSFAWIPGVWKRVLDASLEPAPVSEPESPKPAKKTAKARS